jgi:hypothetical protein
MLRLRRYPPQAPSGNGMKWLPLIFSSAAVLALQIGCGQDEVQRYRIPKESPAPLTALGPASGSMGDGAVPPPPRPEGSLKWTLPKGWTSAQGGGMRFATLKPPIPGRIDVSVVVLQGPAGGELANVNRWRGQIGLPPIDEAALASQRRSVKTKAGEAALFDFTGQGTVKSRMVVGLLSTTDGNTWFLKMIGDDEPVGRTKPDFLHWMESLHLD